MLPSAASSIPGNTDHSSCRNHIALTNGNLGEVTVADCDVTMAKYDEDARTLVVADFVDDAIQHGEDFVAACMKVETIVHTFFPCEGVTSVAKRASDLNLFKWIGHALARVYPLFLLNSL